MDFIPATTKTNRSRNDTEPQNLSRAKPGELHMEKIGASFERRGICFGWQRMDVIALSLPANHLGPAMGETNEHKHCIDPLAPPCTALTCRIGYDLLNKPCSPAPSCLPTHDRRFSAEVCLQQVTLESCMLWWCLEIFQAHMWPLRLQMWISDRVIGTCYVFIYNVPKKVKRSQFIMGGLKI